MNQSTISNQQNQLVSILQRMYNDNIRQINNMTTSINNIRNSNTQIRSLLVQILNHSNTNQTTTRNNSDRHLNNIPYIYDYVEYTTPIYTNRFINRNRHSRTIENFLEPVYIYPTQSQIEIATRNVQYCNILNPINRSCPISLEPFNDTDMVVIIRFCGHIFKPEEIRTWFRSNCICPVCRYDIRNYNNSNTTSNTEQIETDTSNNYVEENNSSIANEERTNTNTNTNSNTNTNTNTNTNSNTSNSEIYLDFFLNNNSNNRTSLNESLINEFMNVLDNGSDANTLLSLFSNVLRRT